MHEIERQRVILGEVSDRPVVTVAQIVDLTGASEATIRRDINALHLAGRLRRVRGGAEALHPPQTVGIAGRPFSVNEGVNIVHKQAIARAAVALCEDGESIIINGGTTTFQMVHALAGHRMQILTNSFPIAEHLLRHSRNTITLPGGAIYREQNIILSPFDNDVARNFYARRMFMSARGLSPIGVMEGDPLIIQAEQKLLNQAEELILLLDSSKFAGRSSLILCPLDRVHTVITDDAVTTRDAKFVEQAGIRLIVAPRDVAEGETSSSAA
ncbi:MAG TPA: DeoR/GlpR family DNA-binding transcription regulator [Bauldia sp.]|jgi:DeoR family ulaG and ulaABCDEF operon transcriptional repressor